MSTTEVVNSQPRRRRPHAKEISRTLSAAGDSVTLTLDLRTAAQNGTHVLSVATDTANAVTESDEANNTKTLTVNIKGNQVR